MERAEAPEDAAYRAKARAWLAENAAEYKNPPEFEEKELVRRARAWAKKKYDAGYAFIAQPKAYGGAGGTPRQQQIFMEEERRYKAPLNLGPGSGLGWQAILRHGTEEQKQRWGHQIASGEAFWCQLFSEPAAGSDLAGLRTRAVKRDGKWIVNGQKIWSSWAHHADHGILIARSDPSLPKHKGLTFFVLDMRQPGITVRPIRQITGHSDFNETFIVDAVIDDADRLGAEGEGWAVAMTVLQAERGGAGGGGGAMIESKVSTRNLIRAARNARSEKGSALDNAAVRAKIAAWHVQEEGVRNFNMRLQAQLKRGAGAPATLPVTKLTGANRGQLAQSFLFDLEEYGGLVQQPGEEGDKFYDYLWSAVMRIAGGADEVLRNQLSERALGMPGDVRADKDVPFDQLPY